MEYRRLGRTGLEVSLMSQGTGGPSLFGQRRGTNGFGGPASHPARA